MEGRLGIKGLREMIVWEGVNTPVTCELVFRDVDVRLTAECGTGYAGRDKFNLTHGSILGISHDFFNVLSFSK